MSESPLVVVWALCTLGFAIANVVLSQQEVSCDKMDEMNLDTRSWLLGNGICSFALLSGIILLFISRPLSACVTITCVLFNICWFIVGAIVIFRGNIDCINDGASLVIYALVMWCLSALAIVEGIRNPRRISVTVTRT